MAVMLGMLGRLAARRRQLLVALVEVATPMDTPQTERLTALLARAYGRQVHLNVSVNPELVGGVRVQIGADVVDSTVLARLEDARRRVGA